MKVLRAACIFDGSRSVGAGWVLIDRGRVTALEKPNVEPPEQAEIADLGDVTLLPGLVDAHVHLGFGACATGAETVAQFRDDDDARLLLRMRLAARRALDAGVTTVRDLGDRSYLGVALRDWFASGPEAGPEILAAGPPVTVPGGHCHFMGGTASGSEIRDAVRARVDHTADVVKVMATGGNLTPETDPVAMQYTLEDLRAAVDEAHRHDRTVTTHAFGLEGIRAAVEAGVDCIEHCGFWTHDGVHADPEDLERIVVRGTAVSVTAGLSPGSMANAPPLVLKRRGATLALMAKLHRLGARIVVGTDGGVADRKPHDVLPHAVAELVEAVGFTPREALASVTALAAEVCGLGDRKGRIAPGYDADLLAVAGDPDADPAALLEVRGVFRAGERVR